MDVKWIYTKNHKSQKNKILNHASQKKYRGPSCHKNWLPLLKKLKSWAKMLIVVWKTHVIYMYSDKIVFCSVAHQQNNRIRVSQHEKSNFHLTETRETYHFTFFQKIEFQSLEQQIGVLLKFPFWLPEKQWKQIIICKIFLNKSIFWKKVVHFPHFCQWKFDFSCCI